MTDNTYNGWTNYATWRVNLEMFDGPAIGDDVDADPYDLGQTLRDMAEETIGECASGLALDYALAFLSDVNWTEIAERMIEDAKEEQNA